MAQSDEPEARGGSHVNANGSAVDAPSSPPKSTQAELAEALKELSRGEQTATALERNLTSLENKLDELLASFEGMGESAVEEPTAEEEKKPRQPETGNNQKPAGGSGKDESR